VSSRYSTRRIDAIDLELLNDAITALELAHKATVLAVLLEDDKGLFFNLRPSMELEVAALLAAFDFKGMLRVVEEHTP
jgi:hypothetical protein